MTKDIDNKKMVSLQNELFYDFENYFLNWDIDHKQKVSPQY